MLVMDRPTSTTLTLSPTLSLMRSTSSGSIPMHAWSISWNSKQPHTTRGNIMRYGYWLPVFGGWLRNVADEGMDADWHYVKRLAQRSEKIGYDLSLIAELNLNDIKGESAPSLDA